jgi:hypothetical protein
MEKFAFEQFIADNKIDVKTLSPNLQKRIRGFEELKDDYQHAIDEDKDKLKYTIENLADELEEDLYDEFEDLLENNDDLDDEPEPVKKPAPVKEAPKTTVQKQVPVPKVQSDEEIIDNLYKMKRFKIGRSALLDMGFKGILSGSKIKVGSFILQRTGMLSYTYLISKSSN